MSNRTLSPTSTPSGISSTPGTPPCPERRRDLSPFGPYWDACRPDPIDFLDLPQPCTRHQGHQPVDGCADCARHAFSPRMAFITAQAAHMLHARLWALRAPLEDVRDVATRLPHLLFTGLHLIAGSEMPGWWFDQYLASYADVSRRIRRGELPMPECVADALALDSILGSAGRVLASGHLPVDLDALPTADWFHEGDIARTRAVLLGTFPVADYRSGAHLEGRTRIEPDAWFVPWNRG